MLEAIIQSRARIELLRAFLIGSEARFYLRELVAKTGLPQGSVQRELANLVGAGILVKEVSGRQNYYRLNQRCPILPELRSILVKTVGIADSIRKALLPAAESISMAFIFGSFGAGNARPDSDIDLFVVGDMTLRRLTALLRSADIPRAINPILMSDEEFRSRDTAGDHFVQAVLASPRVFLIGDEHEFRGPD